MGFKKLDNSFIVSLENKAPHNILLHPLRRLVLKVIIKRGDMKIEHKKIFERVIGKDGKPTMPWLATETIKDTTLKANEKRDIKYFLLKEGGGMKGKKGYFRVIPGIWQNLKKLLKRRFKGYSERIKGGLGKKALKELLLKGSSLILKG